MSDAAATSVTPFYTSSSQNNSTWIIVAFVGFLVVLWGIWRSHAQQADTQLNLARAIDGVGYAAGFQQKQMNDIQHTLGHAQAAAVNWRQDDLRFGVPSSGTAYVTGVGRGRMANTVIAQGAGSEAFASEGFVY